MRRGVDIFCDAVVYSVDARRPINTSAEVEDMAAPRFRAPKGVARRPVARRLAKRRQEVVAFEAWQRHAGDSAPDRHRAAVAKR
jgi:hypothetical protein